MAGRVEDRVGCMPDRFDVVLMQVADERRVIPVGVLRPDAGLATHGRAVRDGAAKNASTASRLSAENATCAAIMTGSPPAIVKSSRSSAPYETPSSCACSSEGELAANLEGRRLHRFAHPNFVLFEPEGSIQVARDIVASSDVKGEASEPAAASLVLGEQHGRPAVAMTAMRLVDVDVIDDQRRLVVMTALHEPEVTDRLTPNLDHEDDVVRRKLGFDLGRSLLASLVPGHPVVPDEIARVLLTQARQPSRELGGAHQPNVDHASASRKSSVIWISSMDGSEGSGCRLPDSTKRELR